MCVSIYETFYYFSINLIEFSKLPFLATVNPSIVVYVVVN